MGVFAGPEINESGLVLALDGANFKSFKGEATTNLIPSPFVNAFPRAGNGWGTYNTNQYGSGTYFSIGTVSNVTNNIVTMTSAHSLRTYDVMQPQSTGGGVTAGTNYFIKKLSDTSFTLHAYNGSQDGSQGYINPSTGTHKVYDSIATDARVSVDASGFPTMWWGYPHLPNSGLVKELRYGEFNNVVPYFPPIDCIRLHYIRTDGVMDGMSYGVDCTVTPGSPVTVSFYTRAATASAVGKQIQYQIYNYSGGSPVGYYHYFTLGALGVWERQTFTFTPANSVMISYWFATSAGVYAWDWSCMQVEQKSYATSFVPGTRGTTVATGGGWADLSSNGNNGELLNGVRENSNNLGSLVFDGSNDLVSKSSSTMNLSSGVSMEMIFKSTDMNSRAQGFMSFSPGTAYINFYTPGNGTLRWETYYAYPGPGGAFFTPTALSNNTWYHAVGTFVGGSSILYINGTSVASASYTAGNYSSSYTSEIRIGEYAGYLSGNIAVAKIYNRALSAAEIQQNFSALRGRFGL